MYNEENPIKVDVQNAFIENKNVFFVESQINTLDLKSEFKRRKKINVVSENEAGGRLLQINLFAGFDSSFTQNEILNSSVYKKDSKLNDYDHFYESEEYLGNKVSVGNNPITHEKTLGIDNSKDFVQYFNEPFEESDNIEDYKTIFDRSSNINFPMFYNRYSLSRLNSSIDVLGTLNEVDGTMLTEKNLQGIKIEIIKEGLDARGRSTSTTFSLKISEKNNSIEPFSDEEDETIISGQDVLLQRSFSYVNKVVNGQIVTTIDTSGSSSSKIPILSNKLIFYTEDDSFIAPFDDKKTYEVKEDDGNNIDRTSLDNIKNIKNNSADYDEDEVFMSTGFNIDNTEGGLPNSIAFAGGID